jgi:hypothetical protein
VPCVGVVAKQRLAATEVASTRMRQGRRPAAAPQYQPHNDPPELPGGLNCGDSGGVDAAAVRGRSGCSR